MNADRRRRPDTSPVTSCTCPPGYPMTVFTQEFRRRARAVLPQSDALQMSDFAQALLEVMEGW